MEDKGLGVYAVYDYIGLNGEITTTSLKHTYYTPATMILFLNKYLTLKERNEIVHGKNK